MGTMQSQTLDIVIFWYGIVFGPFCCLFLVLKAAL